MLSKVALPFIMPPLRLYFRDFPLVPMRVTDRWAYVLLFGLVGVWLWGVPAVAQEVTLRGFIVDRSDGQPLPGANVALQNVQDPQQRIRGAVSNKDGFYQINL